MQSNVNVRNNSGENPSPKNPVEKMAMTESSVRLQRKDTKTPWIILVIVVLAFLALAGYLFRDKLMGEEEQVADKVSDYQAVFLTNGQVYFGKMENVESQYVTLKDIFYLQVNQQQNLQSGTSSSQQQQAQAPEQQPQLSLVKLGNELHGPVDSMQINRDQILFFEDLKVDGRVVEAINQYKVNPEAANQQPAPTQNGGTAPAGQGNNQ